MQGGPLEFISLKMPACDFDVETSLSELWQRSKKVVKFARFLIAQSIKNPPSMLETWVRSLGWEDPLEEGMATQSSILA